MSHINPSYNRKPIPQFSKIECIDGIVAGDVKILSYVISKAESRLPNDQSFVSEILVELKPNPNIRKLAISGSPGVGKSTFINSFGSYLLEQGHRLAILPVDPSSQVSQGSILGDKTRMEDLVNLQNAFIKPMPSSLALGGLAPSSAIAVMICERSHFDYIILETVGVGQSEYEARHLVDMFLLLLQPGGGDDLQGIKRGIIEIADMLIITKADGTLLKNAQISYREYENALKLILSNSYDWSANVFQYSSIEHSENALTGAANIYKGINDYFHFMNEDGRLIKLRRDQELHQFNNDYKKILFNHALNLEGVKTLVNLLQIQLSNGEIIPLQALQRLRKTLHELE